jgi:predicted dehydrogenase
VENSRRDFVKKAITGTAAVSLGGILPGFSAKSYAGIFGANERINVASMGVNSRGFAVGNNFANQPDCRVIYACDVDSRAADKFADSVKDIQGKRPKTEEDFRKALDDKDLDALVITCPDHWHAPAAIMALKAGKHVYVEKPCSHNPHEGELLVSAAKKYNRAVQMGNQRRSYPNSIAAMNELRSGVIGRPYFAKAWYTNNRPQLPKGNKVAVPSWLNYELWQGPAPRQPYMDNIVHYNWHWFWNWGTGEALNNGTHTVDLARWGLNVDYPVRVTSSGGRYQQKHWETPDTQVINLEFENNTMISWEGRSCNSLNVEGESVGVIFYGDNGSLVMAGPNNYKIYDAKDKLIKEVKNNVVINEALRLSGASSQLDAHHIRNFFDGIRKGAKLNSDIEGGHKSTLLVQLGNIALRSGGSLDIDPENGHIINNSEAMKYWSRDYEPGWKPTIA